MDRELTVWLYLESSDQWLYVQVQAGDDGCPVGLCPVITLTVSQSGIECTQQVCR